MWPSLPSPHGNRLLAGACLVAIVLALIVARPGPGWASVDLAEVTSENLPPLSLMKQLSIEDGLPQNTVSAVSQDLAGFIWLGTHGGLVRYDGREFKVFKRSKLRPSLPGSIITSLELDASGRLWIGTADEGISSYDPKAGDFESFLDVPEAPRGVTAIRAQGDTIWFALAEGGVISYDGNAWEKTNLDGMLVLSIDVDASGKLWLGTDGAGPLILDPVERSFSIPPKLENFALGEQLRALLVAGDGALWFGTDQRLCRYAPTSAKLHCYTADWENPFALSNSDIYSIIEDSKGRVWVATREGLNLASEGRFTRFLDDPKDPGKSHFTTIFEDRSGLIWGGTLPAGVMKLDLSRQQLGHLSLGRVGVTSILAESPDRYWFGAARSGLFFVDQKKGVLQRHSLPGVDFESVWITAMHRRGDDLWIGTSGAGLVRYNLLEGSFERWASLEDAGLPIDTIWDIIETPDNSLWLATWGDGVVRIGPGGEMETLTAPEEVGSDYIYDLLYDPVANRMWAGTAGAGVTAIDLAGGPMQVYDMKTAALSNNDCVTLDLDAKGRLLIGTYGYGLNRLDPTTGQAERIEYGDDKSETIFSLAFDKSGKLWIATDGSGLLRINVEEDGHVEVDAFAIEDGVQGMQYIQGAIARRGDMMYFGGTGGLNAFRGSAVRTDTFSPPPVVASIQSRGKELVLDRPPWSGPTIELTQAQSFLTIRFPSLAFADPDRVRYEYRLVGLHSNWLETTKPSASYSSLPGGHYEFQARALNRHGVPSGAVVLLPLYMAPAWYRSTLAYVGYGLMLGLGVFVLVRRQRAKLVTIQRDFRLATAEREIELTAAVQLGFLPTDAAIHTQALSASALYQSAVQCSGDWWWSEAGADEIHYFVVGDVTGHGAGPAMVTAAVATAFRVSGQTVGASMESRLHRINEEVLLVAQGKYNMTLTVVALDPNTSTLTIFNCGGMIPLLFRNGGLQGLSAPGTPLGTEDFNIGRVEKQVMRGDRLIVMTDGLVETQLETGKMYGLKRFAKFVNQNLDASCSELVGRIYAEHEAVLGGRPQEDDWTLIVVDWKAEP